MPSIYPTIKLPRLMTSTAPAATYKALGAPAFDFNSGEFLFDGAGRMLLADSKTAFEDWCIKSCMTERGTRLAYSERLGCEWQKAMKEPDGEAIKSAIIRTVTETIMTNNKAQWVRDFEFNSEGDSLSVSFEVKGKPFLTSSRLTVAY